MPRLIKDRKARELAPPSKAAGTWRYVLAKEKTDGSFVHISFPKIYIYIFVRISFPYMYIFFVLYIFRFLRLRGDEFTRCSD